MRQVAAAIAVFCLFAPRAAAGQTSAARSERIVTAQEERDRLSVQVAAGPMVTLVGGGSVLSAAFGYSPTSRLELIVNVERNHLPFQSTNIAGGSGATRGGSMMFASGEVRFTFLPTTRVLPFVMAGAGRGVSRPNVNDSFPNPIENDLRVLYLGGGVRIPLRHGFSLLSDARCMLGLEGYDSVLGVWPVRAGLAWRF
jgi:hypothetical protein